MFMDRDGAIVAWDGNYRDRAKVKLRVLGRNAERYVSTWSETISTFSTWGDLTGKQWSPASLAGLEMWLDAADAGTANVDGEPVTTWEDRSGNRHTAVATGTPPTFNAAALGVAPAVRFSKTVTPMTIAGMGDAITGASAYTLIAQLKVHDTSAINVLLNAPTDAAWKLLLEFMDVNGIDWGGGGSGSFLTYRTAIAAGSTETLSFVWGSNGTQHDLWRNDTLLTNPIDWGLVPGPIPPLGRDLLMGMNYQDGGGLDADVANLLWFDRALSDAERRQVETYLTDRTTTTPARTIGKVATWENLMRTVPLPGWHPDAGPDHDGIVAACASTIEVTDIDDDVRNDIEIQMANVPVDPDTNLPLYPAERKKDDISVRRYGRHTYEDNTLIHEDPVWTGVIAERYLMRWGSGEPRINSVTLDMLTEWRVAEVVSTMTFGDLVQVIDYLPSDVAMHTLTLEVQGVDHDLTPGSWTTTLRLDQPRLAQEESAPGKWDLSMWDNARWA